MAINEPLIRNRPAGAPRSDRRAGASRDDSPIDLLETVDLLHRHLTDSLCREVFASKRITERQREWSLKALADFWTAVILRAPKALRQALEEAHGGKSPDWPDVGTSPEAFFQRSRNLSWEFFAALHDRFTDSILPEALPVFCSTFAHLRGRFPEVFVWDGSRLDAVAHRLKILWDVRSPILPGCLLAVYDLFRGIPRWLHFDPDSARGEMDRMREVLPHLPKGTLLLGDRLSASVRLFEELTQNGLWGLFRRNARLSLKKQRRLGLRRCDGGVLEDWIVQAGSGQTAAPQTLRWVRYRRDGRTYEVLTNVLDPTHLTAIEAINLYPQRWTVERMFFDLKEVLNLHRFYAANPNAVGMQVYAAALVYTSMRVAQGRAARQVRVDPEVISTAKFFVRIARASCTRTTVDLTVRAIRKANPRVRIREPQWRMQKWARTTLKEVRVEKRKPKRRRRRYCPSRHRWKSFRHVRGGARLIRRRD